MRTHELTTRALLAALLALLVGLLAPLPADAALAEVGVRIDAVELQEDGSSRLVFTVPATNEFDGRGDVRLFEDGEAITAVEVASLTRPVESAPTTTIAVAIDTSGSTAGDAIAAAKAAAASLVTDLVDRGVEVALVAFADEARLVVPPTRDAAALQQAVGALEAGGDTALNDAVLLSARTLVGLDGAKRILLFTDGRDDGSQTSFGLAVEAIAFAEIPVQSIVLETADTAVAPLEALARTAGGSVDAVSDVTGLAAAFETVVRALPSTWELTWRSERRGESLALRLEIGPPTKALVDEATVLNPRRGTPLAPRPVTLPQAGPLGGLGLPFALFLFGAGLVALFAMLFTSGGDKRVSQTLQAAAGSAGAALRERRERKRDAEPDEPSLRRRLTSRAAELVETVPKPTGYDDDLSLRLERAGWSVRPAEFQVMRLAAAVGAFVLGAGLAQHLVVGAVAGALGFFVPGILADSAHQKRQDAFVEQMPDVLQLLSGSLKAGYGVVQAMDLVVEESAAPISTEFRRVLNEHLLGLELEDALDAMARRIDSDDLHWVVVAMNIQRRVGGNLAELLDIVANTLRERGTVRRHVRALSAEGRLSARVLTAMPFLIGGYVGIVNPEYIGLLFTDPRGRVMMVAALVAMGVGTLWMRKLVDIEV